ncbi:MAG: substrate-binding domain-containing protein [Sulfolobales archaeon]
MIGVNLKYLIFIVVIIAFLLPQVNNITFNERVIRISTTTSLYQLGLVDALMNGFLARYDAGVRYEVIVAGSGEALRLLADGTTCVAFTHAPSLEHELIVKGYIRRLGFVGFNEFVIVGPKEDPANVSKALNTIEAFSMIYSAGELGLTKFVSRGDYSGTHVREVLIWNLSGLNPKGRSWYLEIGQGMQQALIMTDDIRGYTISDSGTYAKLITSGKLRNTIALLNDTKNLINIYSLYASNSNACNSYNDIITMIANYVMSDGQDLISERFKGLVTPFVGYEDIVSESWEYLAVGGRS